MSVYVPLDIKDLQALKEVMDDDSLFAGAGNAQPYILAEDLPKITAALDAAAISNNAASLPPKGLKAAEKKEDPGYVPNTGEDESAEKLEEGSDKIESDDPEVQALLDQILAEAGLSEKPAGMSDAEYEKLVAKAISKWVNENFEYIKDTNSDYWQSVKETLAKMGGDCEDMAILKASLLIAAGIDPNSVAVVVSEDGTHAFVAVEIDGVVYVLDNGAGDNFIETQCTTLEEFLNDSGLAGAWFTQNGYGVIEAGLEIDTASNGDPVLAELNAKFSECSDQLAELEDSVSAEDFYYTDENGYRLLDANKLEAWFQQMMVYIYILEMLAIVGDAYAGRASRAAQVQGNSASSSVGQMLDTRAGNANMFIQDIFSNLLEYNQAIYQKDYEAADKENDSFWERLGDFFSGGGNSIDVMEARIKAGEKFEAVIKKLVQGVIQVLSSLSPKAAEIAGKMGSLVSTGENGYMDIDLEALMDLRRVLAADSDIQQCYLEMVLAKADQLLIVVQLSFDTRVSNSRSMILKVAGAIKNHLMGVFDQAANAMLLRKQIFNQINYDKLQLEKLERSQGWNIFAAVLTCVALVASLVAAFFTAGSTLWITFSLIAVGSGLTAGAVRWGTAAYYDDAIDDEYKPMENFDLCNDLIAENSNPADLAMQVLSDLEQKEQLLFKKFGKNMLFSTNDIFKSIDYQAFLGVTDQWENIKIIREAVIDIEYARAQRALLAAKISFGFDVASGMRQIIDNFVESDKGQKDLGLEGIKYQLNDLKWAWNMERSQEIAMDNSTRSFLISTLSAIAGGLIASGLGGSFVYFGIGYGIASSLGGATAEVVNAQTSVDAVYNRDDEILKMLKESAQCGCGDELEQKQNALLVQLLEDTKVSIGRGQKELSSSKVSRIQFVAGVVETIRSILIDLKVGRSEFVRDYNLAEAGASGPDSKLTEKIKAESSQTLLKKINYILSVAREAMEAGNRAARAREAADHAAVNFWISLGVGAAMAATGGCLAGFGSVASGAVRAGMVLLKLTAPAMNLATGINNIIYYAGLAEEDKGGLEDDYETVKQQRALEVRSQALGAAGKLSALEEALFEEAGKNLLSKFGMNAGFFSGFQSRLERLYKIKEIVDELLENEVEKILTALEIMGGIVKKFHFLSEAERNSKIAAFSAIENILNTLRSIGSRDNEIREARLMLIKSVVSSSLSAIEIILSFINVNRSEKAHELKLAEESGGLDVNGRRDLDNLNTQNEFWSTVPVLLKLVGILKVFSGLLTTAIYRAAQDEKTADGPEEGESPEENAKGMGTAMYALETDTVNAQMASGEGSLEREQVLQDADLADEGIAAGRGATEESISMFDSWKREDDQKRIKAGLQEEKKEAAARLKFHNGEGPTIISSC